MLDPRYQKIFRALDKNKDATSLIKSNISQLPLTAPRSRVKQFYEKHPRAPNNPFKVKNKKVPVTAPREPKTPAPAAQSTANPPPSNPVVQPVAPQPPPQRKQVKNDKGQNKPQRRTPDRPWCCRCYHYNHTVDECRKCPFCLNEEGAGGRKEPHNPSICKLNPEWVKQCELQKASTAKRIAALHKKDEKSLQPALVKKRAPTPQAPTTSRGLNATSQVPADSGGSKHDSVVTPLTTSIPNGKEPATTTSDHQTIIPAASNNLVANQMNDESEQVQGDLDAMMEIIENGYRLAAGGDAPQNDGDDSSDDEPPSSVDTTSTSSVYEAPEVYDPPELPSRLFVAELHKVRPRNWRQIAYDLWKQMATPLGSSLLAVFTYAIFSHYIRVIVAIFMAKMFSNRLPHLDKLHIKTPLTKEKLHKNFRANATRALRHITWPASAMRLTSSGTAHTFADYVADDPRPEPLIPMIREYRAQRKLEKAGVSIPKMRLQFRPRRLEKQTFASWLSKTTGLVLPSQKEREIETKRKQDGKRIMDAITPPTPLWKKALVVYNDHSELISHGPALMWLGLCALTLAAHIHNFAVTMEWTSEPAKRTPDILQVVADTTVVGKEADRRKLSDLNGPCIIGSLVQLKYNYMRNIHNLGSTPEDNGYDWREHMDKVEFTTLPQEFQNTLHELQLAPPWPGQPLDLVSTSYMNEGRGRGFYFRPGAPLATDLSHIDFLDLSNNLMDLQGSSVAMTTEKVMCHQRTYARNHLFQIAAPLRNYSTDTESMIPK